MVIDKVDKPERSPYRVESTVETRGQKHQRQGEERKEDDEYSESSGVKGWQKFHVGSKDRKIFQLRVLDIRKMLFNKVAIQRGMLIIDVDIQLINGQIFRHAFIYSTNIDLYWKLKKKEARKPINITDIVDQDYIEISVMPTKRKAERPKSQEKPAQKSEIAQDTMRSWGLWPLYDMNSKKFNWVAIVIYSIVIISIMIVFLTLI